MVADTCVRVTWTIISTTTNGRSWCSFEDLLVSCHKALLGHGELFERNERRGAEEKRWKGGSTKDSRIVRQLWGWIVSRHRGCPLKHLVSDISVVVKSHLTHLVWDSSHPCQYFTYLVVIGLHHLVLGHSSRNFIWLSSCETNYRIAGSFTTSLSSISVSMRYVNHFSFFPIKMTHLERDVLMCWVWFNDVSVFHAGLTTQKWMDVRFK